VSKIKSKRDEYKKYGGNMAFGFTSMFSAIRSFTFGSNAAMDSGPTVNIDGTPMVGDFDINGNAYGVMDSGNSFSNDSLDSSIFESGMSSGAIDANDAFSSNDTFCPTTETSDFSSSEDSFSSIFGSDDAFSSDWSSNDDMFSSSWDD
jgi:hypothetical protein